MRFVRSSKKPAFGLGVVTAHGDAQKLKVLFENAGYKAVLPEALVEVPDAEVPEQHPLRHPEEWQRVELDVKRAESLRELGTPLKFDAFIQEFQRQYPDGLRSPVCEAEARSSKLEASLSAQRELAPELLGRLLEQSRHVEILERARACLAKFDGAFDGELAKFADVPASAAEEVAPRLVTLARGGEHAPEALEDLARVLAPHGAAKWPIVSIVPHLLYPERWPFVKPLAIERLQQATCISVEYDPRPNARSYRRIQEFYTRVFAILTERGFAPRDLIDAQTFFGASSGLRCGKSK